jgi:DinB superfamily
MCSERMNSRSTDQLDGLLDDIAGLVAASREQLQLRRPSISAWSVAQQLDHVLKVCSAILKGLLCPGDPPPRGIKFIGRAILFAGWIPRGRGRAPDSVLGTEASSEELTAALEETRQLLAAVRRESFRPADEPAVMHPFFGGLTPSQTLRVIVVHTRHHLKIVREIREG